MTYGTLSTTIVGVGVKITPTPNVKRKTKECRLGSGGALSAKQEKLGLMSLYCKT